MGRASSLLVLVATVAAVTLLWNTPVIWPLKIMTVFFHEISHGLACLATGGTFGTITISANEGGLHLGAGGSRFIVLSAGYLGSLLWGCGLLLLAAWVKRDAIVVGVLGISLGLITLGCVRNGFGFGFGLATSAALVISARFAGHAVNELILQIIGATSALYVIPDIWSDVIARSGRSDATMLAEYTLIPAIVWGGMWLILSLVVVSLTVRTIWRTTAQPS